MACRGGQNADLPPNYFLVSIFSSRFVSQFGSCFFKIETQIVSNFSLDATPQTETRGPEPGHPTTGTRPGRQTAPTGTRGPACGAGSPRWPAAARGGGQAAAGQTTLGECSGGELNESVLAHRSGRKCCQRTARTTQIPCPRDYCLGVGKNAFYLGDASFHLDAIFQAEKDPNVCIFHFYVLTISYCTWRQP